jgi:hypothetical protein
MKSLVVAVLGVLAVFYLLNPGAGVFELIPDNFPFIGNLDEAGAVFLILACLRYFNIDLVNIFRREAKPGRTIEHNADSEDSRK